MIKWIKGLFMKKEVVYKNNNLYFMWIKHLHDIRCQNEIDKYVDGMYLKVEE